MKKVLIVLFSSLLLLSSITVTFAANPSSTNFELKDYSFGAGGTDESTSGNYGIMGIIGQIIGGKQSSTNFKVGSGLVYGVNTNVPSAPSVSNPDRYYNKLHVVLNTGGNPTDTVYAVAVSADNFASDTRFVQDDNTLDTTLGSEDWQTYTSWGGAGGFDMIGLVPGTTYTVKVTAKQGNYSQSPYSATTQVATENVTLSFDIDVASSDSETAPPYAVDFGTLTTGAVNTASDKIWVDLDTNAVGGGYVYIYDQHGGLRSSTVSYTINSASTDLASGAVQEGFGLQSSSVDQDSGGPVVPATTYDLSGDNVGVVNATVREVFNSSSEPVTDGRASLILKAKTKSTTPASNDYADTLTLIASGTF